MERRPPAPPRPARRAVLAPPPGLRHRSGRPRVRLIAALIVLAGLLGVIVARVAQLQTSEADSLRSAGSAQWTRSIDLPAQRGTVFDRHGNELALSVPSATISINPKLIENGPATIQLLDDLLDLDDEQVVDLLNEVARKERGFVYVARQADAGIGDQIASLGLSGVNVDREGRREMPGGDTGRSVIGRTNIDGVGISGLELQFDDVLTGTGGSMSREVAPGGRSIPGSETIVEAPVPGHDLVLTLDRSIQYSTEQVLLEQVRRIGARGATAIAMEPSTGEIFSMASVRQDDDTGEYEVTNGNFALVDSYEPGSVAKVITIASALSEGTVTPENGFEVPWRKKYYDDLLHNSFQHPTQWMNIEQILVSSHNIGTIFVQETLGRWVHRDYMAAFGLGERTALDFPGESPGILKEADDLWGSERVTVAYGQGVASTSLQLVAAVNTIANDGVYVEPRLVRSTVEPDGTMTEQPASATRRAVTADAANQTTSMMQQVVCRGTAKRAQVEGVPIAGKTGTAFKAADNGTYFDDEGNRIYYASFVGFFPADDPQVTVLVSVDEPPAGTQDRFGGTAAAPVFAELAPTLINELGVQPPLGGDGCPPAT
ncbi:MAG: penicillin-binding protein 2 [Ilumatobacteraceae bacterium]|nr:penicillin-binding protein 2 [Ilumatobacteraceae bacterium]